MTMTMSQLPEDLVEEEILCRVPATSLKRLRSSCKLWNGLFNDRRFAKKHFDRAAKQSMALMLTKESRIFSLSADLHELKGELSLPSDSAPFHIFEVFHCDGLLLCTNEVHTRLVVWNPCTGQTKWIIQPELRPPQAESYTLGCYQDYNSHNNSYKILRRRGYKENLKFEIYEISSDLWRTLDGTPDCLLFFTRSSVFFKGKTYLFAEDEKDRDPDAFLLVFDYRTERFARLGLPGPHLNYETMSLSVVREEKLSVLIRAMATSEVTIWVRDEVDETKVVSWRKIFAVDDPRLGICLETSFLVDEEKNKALCCDKWKLLEDLTKVYDLVYIVEEDNEVTQVDSGVSSSPSLCSLLLDYVPSLSQIH